MRKERDSLGEIEIDDAALWGAQTQRAVNNFPISGMPLPPTFIAALGLIKSCAAVANRQLGELDSVIAKSIVVAADRIAAGEFAAQFPVDVFQTGSGTSTNMNANEVIAALANEGRELEAHSEVQPEVHPNDHVNRGQSSNDVIPTAIHVAACLEVEQRLLPAISTLGLAINRREEELNSIVKTGRTHLMDAMPVTLGQELSGWSSQVAACAERLNETLPRLRKLAIGGTAVGTGINAHPDFAMELCRELHRRTGISFVPATNRFAAQSSQDTAVELSGQMRVLAAALMKISNDLRLMNSGPLAGFAEISLPALQPGSSIMPGKVNPVIPEAVAMVCAKVYGNDTTVALSGQAGQFQLNTMLPVIAHCLLESIEILAGACRVLGQSAIAGFTVNYENLETSLHRNPVLVTALNSEIGYTRAAEIAKKAYAEKRPVIDVAEEMTDISRDRLERILDPAALT